MNLQFLKSTWYNAFILCIFLFVMCPIYISVLKNGFELKPYIICFFLMLPQLIKTIVFFAKKIHIRITFDF